MPTNFQFAPPPKMVEIVAYKTAGSSIDLAAKVLEITS